MNITIQVTKQDFKEIRSQATHNPVSKAINRAIRLYFGLAYVVECTEDTIAIYNPINKKYRLYDSPLKVNKFLTNFNIDRSREDDILKNKKNIPLLKLRNYKPFSFNMDINKI